MVHTGSLILAVVVVILNFNLVNCSPMQMDIQVLSNNEEDGGVQTYSSTYTDLGVPGKVSSSSCGSKKAFQNEALDFINQLRSRHHVDPLVLDREMTSKAQKYAETISANGKLEISCKSKSCGYGENLAKGPPNDDIGAEVKMSIERWYASGTDFDYKTGKSKKGGNNPYSFTALVWKGSKKAGIGAVKNEDTGYIYIVVQFAPAGNIMGAFVQNVLLPGTAVAEDISETVGSTVDDTSDDQAPGNTDEHVIRPKPKQIKEIQTWVLIRINIIRKNHKAPPLVIDIQLMADAQAYAEELAVQGKLSTSCKSKHCDYGENLASVSQNPDLNMSINITLQRWYNGQKDYDFKTGTGKPNSVTGTFTALVWKSTKKFGIGIATNREDGKVYIVFRFSPPGNMKGEYTKNVFPPLKNIDEEPSNDEALADSVTENPGQPTKKPGKQSKTGKPEPAEEQVAPTDVAKGPAPVFGPDSVNSKPINKPDSKLDSKPNPTTKPDKSDSQPAGKPTTKPVDKPNTKPNTKSDTNPNNTPVGKPTSKPKSQPNGKSSDPDDDNFQDLALGFINKLRKKHKVPPVTLAEDMNTIAQKGAENMALAGALSSSCKKSKTCQYSENSAMTSAQPTISIAINMTIQSWYDENSNYDFVSGKPINSLVVKDFTTLVWKSVTKIGVGAAIGQENDYVYIIVLFSPLTNIAGQYLSNVFPASSNDDDAADDIYEIENDSLTEDWRVKVLAKMNELRAKHGSPPVALDQPMTTRAQTYSLSISISGKLVTSCKGNCGYGENLGMGAGGKEDMAAGCISLVLKWYEQNIEYDYVEGKSKSKKPVGSFTALVWKGSRKVGIGGGIKKSNGYIYLVVQFSPAGNMKGDYLKNVLKPKDEAEAVEAEAAETTPSPTKPTKPPAVKDDGKLLCPAKGACPETKGMEQYQLDGLAAINELREKHHVEPLCLDENLNKNTQRLAVKIGTKGRLELSCTGNNCCYGEIQAQRPPNDDLSEETKNAIQKWYDEIADYNFEKGLPTGKKMITGFSAIVWKGSTRVGIGAFASEETQSTWVVIQFSPPGNTRNQYVANVLPE